MRIYSGNAWTNPLTCVKLFYLYKIPVDKVIGQINIKIHYRNGSSFGIFEWNGGRLVTGLSHAALLNY